MMSYDYYQGKKDAYNEFKEYADFCIKGNIISKDFYDSLNIHINNVIKIFDEMQEIELEKMRKDYE